MTQRVGGVRVPAVDEDVPVAEQRQEGLEGGVDRPACRDHDPHDSPGGELLHKFLERTGTLRTPIDDALNRFGVEVETDDAVASPDEPFGHVGSHLAEADHANVHVVLLSVTR